MLVHPQLDRRMNFLKVGVFVGHVVLKIGTVRDVAIDKKIGSPFVPELEPRPRFGGVGFHVVAVEVEII